MDSYTGVLTLFPALPGMRTLMRLATVAMLAATLVVMTSSAAQTFYVEGSSMAPSLHTGQLLLVNRLAYWRLDGSPLEQLLPGDRPGSPLYVLGGPRRGDVVVFQAPMRDDDCDYVKRVIGLPGDAIQVVAGQVSVNGQPLSESYVAFPDDYSYPIDGTAVVVPDDAYFVLGDNRGVSNDSHMGWFVPADNLVGRALPLPLGSA
jgi:signal peptidase I